MSSGGKKFHKDRKRVKVFLISALLVLCNEDGPVPRMFIKIRSDFTGGAFGLFYEQNAVFSLCFDLKFLRFVQIKTPGRSGGFCFTLTAALLCAPF
jgi:hypothetical protein